MHPALQNLAQQASTSNQQDQVLRAINDSVSSTVPPALIFGAVGGLLAVLIAISVYQRYRKPPPPGTRRFVRNSKKLLKDTARELGISPAELHKLKHHAERLGIDNPLTLLLCPSLLKKEEAKE